LFNLLEMEKKVVIKKNFKDKKGDIKDEIMDENLPIEMTEKEFTSLKYGWKKRIEKHIQDQSNLSPEDIKNIKNALEELLSAYDEWYKNKNEGMMKKEMAKENLEKVLKIKA